MIHHISLAVAQPLVVAQVLARFWQSEALPFPMYNNSFVVFCGEESGSCIEIYPEATRLAPSTPELPALVADQSPPGGAFHAAISVPVSAEAIQAICQAANWFCQVGPRGNFFHVVEVWVENHTLLELLTPEMTAEYVAFANQRNWKAIFESPSVQS
ncbi:hypothetical protein [Halioxenophilus sp. WMMB6]|uniref:hypothetical protein n=1 Tax=Halioxenophilus sp. WMMB6 TaxID=3073815 RepID=UPI00295ED28B|nr:hypothetical protein [Halioxenophilus sp. WMMB6]